MQHFNSTVGFHSSRQPEGAAVLQPPQKQQQQQQQQRFNQRRHFGVAKQVYNASTGSLGNGQQHLLQQAPGRVPHHRGGGGNLSETMRIFERSQQQHLQHRKLAQPSKEVVAAAPSAGVLPPLETAARRSNASSGNKPADATIREQTPTGLDANQNYLPIITTSRSDIGGKLTGRQQQSLTAAAVAAAAAAAPTPAAEGSPDAKSETGAEPPTVRPGHQTNQQHQQHLPPPQQPPSALLPSSHVQQQQLKQQQQQQQQQSNRKSAPSRRRRIKGVGGGGPGGGGKKGAAAAAVAIKAKRIPIVYFSPENGSVHSGRLEDVDSRSCDMRDPNATIAYGNVLDYIRENQLMSSRKAKLIWAWIRDLDAVSSTGLFVYDPNLRWYSLPGELVGSGDVL